MLLEKYADNLFQLSVKSVTHIAWKVPSGAHAFSSGFHRGSFCPVICVSLFHVIVLSFGFEF